jgi:hypothetical protein
MKMQIEKRKNPKDNKSQENLKRKITSSES